MEFLFEYGLFLAKVVTGVVALVIVVSIVVGLSQKNRQSGSKGHLEITPLNEMFDESLHKAEDKRLQKEKQKKAKELQKANKKASKDPEAELPTQKPRVFVVNFYGNISASAVTNLREEVTAILSQASANDEVVVRLESGGGMVHSSGSYSQTQDSPHRLCRQGGCQWWLYDGLCRR